MLTDAEINKIVRGLRPIVDNALKTYNDEVLNVNAVCKLLKRSRRTIYKAMENNEIPFHKLNGKYVFSKNEVINSIFQRG